MNDSIKRISLDIHKASSGEAVNAKRGDTGRTIHISLVDGGVPYIISEGCYAVFTATKPDGNVVYNACTIENNTIIYEVTEQTAAVEGRVNCEIKLYGSDGKLITSPKFTILVHKTVYSDGDKIESSNEFNALTALVTEAQKALESVDDVVSNAQGVVEKGQNVVDEAQKAINDAKDATSDAREAIKDIQDMKSSINDEVISDSTTWSSNKIKREILHLTYKPIEIVSFKATPSTVEVGSTVDIELSWELNRYPTTIKLTDISGKEVEGITKDIIGSHTLFQIETPANYPTSRALMWNLSAWDEKLVHVNKRVFVYFGNNIFYGVGEKAAVYTQEFIKGLGTKVLVTSRQYTFTVNADTGKHIYFCLPANYGNCEFKVDGFTGGFTKVPDVVSLTNASGYTENYCVYRSDNTGLGNTTVTVS